jgi:Rrf2 family iron-sulfur cluster assembly transcriptional regulator
MQVLSKTARYALRALVVLASQPAESRMTALQLAKRTEISIHFLQKVMWRLTRAQFVSGTRGKHGGFALRHSPHQLRLSEIVGLFEHTDSRPSCVLGWEHCSDSDPCSAHHKWRDIREACANFVDETTLAEITTSRTPKTGKRRGTKSLKTLRKK